MCLKLLDKSDEVTVISPPAVKQAVTWEVNEPQSMLL